ncbi:hypothetical protein O181_050593 [Austropuccinia psidii MF-1]|uniref:Uncharacterized protein n=1 Tax=Austropuccinia psidii MF-1 TaxID=1389203 RepID=A0A9Q3HMI2_9BASI|nr:hypothetical protein [Austropuccinia psidii MF-1]
MPLTPPWHLQPEPSPRFCTCIAYDSHVLATPSLYASKATIPSPAYPLLRLPHPASSFFTAYHAHAHAVASQYASDTSTPWPPSSILML